MKWVKVLITIFDHQVLIAREVHQLIIIGPLSYVFLLTLKIFHLKTLIKTY